VRTAVDSRAPARQLRGCACRRARWRPTPPP